VKGCKKMEYMGTKEAAKKWGCDQKAISRWCREGRIEGAEQDKKGCPWRIPVNAKCPKKINNSKMNSNTKNK